MRSQTELCSKKSQRAQADSFHRWRLQERERLLELYRSHLELAADEARFKKALARICAHDS